MQIRTLLIDSRIIQYNIKYYTLKKFNLTKYNKIFYILLTKIKKKKKTNLLIIKEKILISISISCKTCKNYIRYSRLKKKSLKLT